MRLYMEIKLNNKYVIGTHVMWFEIEMYKDFVDGLLNLMETVENPENVSIDICFNMTERLETIDREKTSPEDLIHKFNEQTDRLMINVGSRVRMNTRITDKDDLYFHADYRGE